MDIPVLPEILVNFFWGIIGLLVGNKLAIGRDKRKEFNDVSQKIREQIKHELDYTKTNYYLPNIIKDLEYISQYIPIYYRFGYNIVKNTYKQDCKECSHLDEFNNLQYKAPTCKTIISLKLLNSYLRRR